jgi:hypothetical protein
MIVSKKVKMKKMGNKNLKYYIGLGYIVEKDSNEFWVSVEHLTPGSKCFVDAQCDFCNKIVQIKYYLYLKNITSHNLFACSSKCGKNKTIKTCLEKFGVEYPNQSEEVREKTIKTNLQRWGVETPITTDEVKQKVKNTNLEKWGVEWTFQSKEIRNKSKQTLLERFGVDHNFKSKEVRAKSKETLIKNWGVDNPSKSEQIKDKKKITSLNNWGTEIPTQSDIIKEKIRATNLEKLGVEYPMQSEEVREKSKKTINDKWGVKHNSQIEELKKNMKLNNLPNWGVEYTLQSPEIREKINLTLLQKYNAVNALQNEEVRAAHFKIAQDINYLRYKENNISVFWCDEGSHEFEISSSMYSNRTKIGCKLCTICYPVQSSVSIKELELLNFIKSGYSGEVIGTYRDGKEIDVYLPELNLGFEFNGLYWHSEKFANKSYHIDKTQFFSKKGIRIIHIWEDDWTLKRSILESQIKNWMGITDRKIPARKCLVKEIGKESVDFLNKNHIQGSDKSGLKLGLFYGEELVSVMTFDRFEGRKKMEEGGWNLSRFCNLTGTNVVGGASKLLSYFTSKYKPSRIVSYADRDWSDGGLYRKLGFNLISEGRPDYKYIVEGMRVHKSNFKKSKLKYTETEKEYVEKSGIEKVWDCGKSKFEMSLK